MQIAVSHQGRIYVPGHTVGCLYLLTVIQIPIFANLSPTAQESNHFVYRKALCAKNYRIKILNLIFWIISNCIFFYSLFFRIFFVKGSSFQRIMAMCNRQLVFDKLRPLCVQLSKDHSRKNVVAVTKALEGIDRGCIQDLQEYLLFPLRIILKQPTK